MLFFNYFKNHNLIKTLSRLFLLIFCFNHFAYAIESEIEKTDISKLTEKPLKISIMSDNAPYSYRLRDGRLIGYYVEYWELWSKTNDIEIEFLVGDYNENIYSTSNNLVDFHSGLFATENRSQWAKYSIPFDRIDTSVFYLNTRSKPINSILDTQGLRVAIQPFTSQEKTLPKKYPEIDFIKVSTFDDLISGLVDGKFDAVIGEVYPLENAFRKVGALELITKTKKAVYSNNIYALVHKNKSQLIDIINQGIRNIPKKELILLANKWVPGQTPFIKASNIAPSIGLTKEETLLLENIGDLHLGVGKFWKPIEFFGDDLIHQGISSDYLKRLENDLGLYFESDHRLTWSQITEKIKNKEIDILSAVGATEERKKYLNFTEPYLQIPMVIVVKKNSIYIQKPEDLVGFTVGASRSNPIKDIWNKHYPNIPLTITSSSNQGLQDVQDGKLNAFLSNLITISPKIKNTFTELEVVAVIPHNINVAFGVRKGLEKFIPILNKWLKNISPEDRNNINKVWLNSEVKQGTNFFSYALQWSPLVLLGLFISAFITKKNKLLAGNIEKRIEVEAQLEKAKTQSQIANRNKEHFLANMSHEVRTPINALVGTAHLLEQSGLSQNQKSYVETLNYSANSLLLLVDDISDFSKIESGDLSLDKKTFGLKNELKNIFAQANINNSNDKVHISYEIEHSLPTELVGDPQRLGQIITNLLSNSIKFTKKGTIKLNVSLDNNSQLENTKDRISLNFTIQDTGIGMTAQQQGMLFQAYTQTTSSIAREYGGTGLGLAICKKLCELMQGKIRVESKLNQGSCFTFTAQLGLVKKSSNEASKTNLADENSDLNINAMFHQRVKEKLKNKNILIVDDNMVNLMIAKKILDSFDVIVSTATNGKKAIEALSKSSYDLVLMDIQMPEMDGYEATQHIRNKLKLNLPVIALSANVMENDRKLSKQSGMNEHLGKPIKVEELVSTLASFLS